MPGDDPSASRDEVSLLAARLRPSGGLRCRTGLLLVPPAELDDVAQWGARFGVDTIAYGEKMLADLPLQTRFVSINAESEAERLRQIADSATGTPVLLVSQFDLALARLDTSERSLLWQHILKGLTQTVHGLLFAMPPHSRLLPEAALLEEMRNAGRVAAL